MQDFANIYAILLTDIRICLVVPFDDLVTNSHNLPVHFL